MSEITRRELFRRGGTIAVGMMAPPWLAAVAKADMVRLSKGQKVAKDTVLITTVVAVPAMIGVALLLT